MHPLAALDEAELASLARVADRLLENRHLLAPGQRSNRSRSGFGIEFLDRREYSPGDDIRALDWRASARSRHPLVRRYCDEASSDWFILLDCSSSMAFGRGEKWTLALQCAAAMAYLLIHLGNRVGVAVFSDRVEHMLPPGRGQAHYAAILRQLRDIRPAARGSGSRPGCCAARIRRNSPLFVISDFLRADAMRTDLDLLGKLCDRLHSIQILDEDDCRPPPRGWRLQDVESGTVTETGIGEQQLSYYPRALETFELELERYCRRQRIHFSRHKSAEPWKSVLVEHLKNAGNSR